MRGPVCNNAPTEQKHGETKYLINLTENSDSRVPTSNRFPVPQIPNHVPECYHEVKRLICSPGCPGPKKRSLGFIRHGSTKLTAGHLIWIGNSPSRLDMSKSVRCRVATRSRPRLLFSNSQPETPTPTVKFFFAEFSCEMKITEK